MRRPPAAGAPATAPDEATPDEAMAPGDTAARDDKAPDAPPPEAAPARTAPTPKQVDETPPPPAEPAPAPGPSMNLQAARRVRSAARRALPRPFARGPRAGGPLRLAPGRAPRVEGGARLRDPQGRGAAGRRPMWDSGDKPVHRRHHRGRRAPVKPGPHALTVRLEIRPGPKKEGQGRRGLGYTSEHTFAIVVGRRQAHDADFTGDEDGSLPEYEPELELETRDGKHQEVTRLLTPCARPPWLCRRSSRIRSPSTWPTWRRAAVWSDEGQPGDPGGPARRAGRGRGRAGHGQRADRDHAPVRDRRGAALREVRVRARVPERRADAGARAGARRAPTPRPSATWCGCWPAAPKSPFFARRLPRHGRHRARDARSRRPCWRSWTADGAGRRCPATAPTSATIWPARCAYGRGEFAGGERALLGRRSPVALLRVGAVFPRPHRRAAQALRRRPPQPVRDRRAGRQRAASPSSSTGATAAIKDLAYPGAGPHRPRAGQVRRRLLLLFPRARGFGAAARRAVRGVVVDVPEGRVRGGRRLHRGVRPGLPRLAAGARRAAAARDDRSQVVPVRSTCARRWTCSCKTYAPIEAEVARADRRAGRGADACTGAC